MTSRSGVKGYLFEKLLVDGLINEGYEIYRPRAGQPQDEGDIIGVPGWTIQAKNHKKLSLPSAIVDAQEQAINGGTDFYCVAHKRYRNNNFYDQLITLDVRTWLKLIKHVK